MKKAQKAGLKTGELERVEQIKKLVVIAMFSDDGLMERLVLKGGNAVDLVYKAGARASADIDLSMNGAFAREELRDVRDRIRKNLLATFGPAGYAVFDLDLKEKPKHVSPEIESFWGGYDISFKLIEACKYAEFEGDLDSLRRNSIRIGEKGKIGIDISKFEYCEGKQAYDMDGYRIFVYTPEMVVCEKLRAICQQMPEYGQVVMRSRPGSARARDFVDIFTLTDRFKIDLTIEGNRNLLRHIFAAKQVPRSFLGAIKLQREFHRPDFQSVRDTVKAGTKLQEYDFYFDFVVGLCARLETLGDV